MAKKSRSKTIPLIASFIGILCLYFPVTTTTAAAASESDAAVDFLYLTFVWPGAHCYLEKCCRPTTADAHEPAYDFVIEDIKTYDSRTGETVTNCNTTCKFSVLKMKGLIPDLYTYWYSTSCPCNNNEASWKNTWCTYGQCSKLSQHDYFQAAINISARANLLEVFNANDIKPSSITYKRKDIENALMANFGSLPHVECIKNTKGGWESTLLSKISFCVTADGQHIIECPFTVERTCNSKLFFYPFTSKDLHECDDDDDAAGSAGDLIKMATEKHLVM